MRYSLILNLLISTASLMASFDAGEELSENDSISSISSRSPIEREHQKKDIATYFSLSERPRIVLYRKADVPSGRHYSGYLMLEIDPYDSLTSFVENIPAGQVQTIELYNLPGLAFDNNAIQIFKDIERVLKPGGALRFNDMWAGGNASDLKEIYLQAFEDLRTDSPALYKDYEDRHPKEFVEVVRGALDLNPFDQYLTTEEYKNLTFLSFHNSLLFPDYKKQLKNFFTPLGLIDMEWNEEIRIWSLFKTDQINPLEVKKGSTETSTAE